MKGRRIFLKKSLVSASLLVPGYLQGKSLFGERTGAAYKPLILSTWNHGMAANDRAWEVLNEGQRGILDAVEEGVKITELDLSTL